MLVIHTVPCGADCMAAGDSRLACELCNPAAQSVQLYALQVV